MPTKPFRIPYREFVIPAHTAVRFWGYVDRSSPDGCWPWLRSVRPDGYGQFWDGNCVDRAHRVAYRLEVGPIDRRDVVLHACDNPLCVRPAHLTVGTLSDNHADMVAKGRHARHSSHGCAKLTPDQVAAIRTEYIPRRVTQERLAAKYGVSRSHISEIIHGHYWTGQ